jgi:hypothetical protein
LHGEIWSVKAVIKVGVTDNYSLNIIFPKALNPFLHGFFIRLQGQARSYFEKPEAADVGINQDSCLAIRYQNSGGAEPEYADCSIFNYFHDKYLYILFSHYSIKKENYYFNSAAWDKSDGSFLTGFSLWKKMSHMRAVETFWRTCWLAICL